MAKTKIVVMVGSGFSAAMTAASPALATPGLVGNSALPTLCDLTAALRQHAEQEIHRRGSGDFPFQRDTLRQTLTDLEAATWRGSRSLFLKPHGSIHFFRAKDGGDSDRIVAVHPRLDL